MDEKDEVFSARVNVYESNCPGCGRTERVFSAVCEQGDCRNQEISSSEERITYLAGKHASTHVPVDREVVGVNTYTIDLQKKGN